MNNRIRQPMGKGAIFQLFGLTALLLASLVPSRAHASSTLVCVDSVGTNECPGPNLDRTQQVQIFGPTTITIFQQINITQNASAAGANDNPEGFFFNYWWDNGPVQSRPEYFTPSGSSGSQNFTTTLQDSPLFPSPTGGPYALHVQSWDIG